MNKQDKEAFEKWFDEILPKGWTAESAWQAALEYERERSKILVEALSHVADSVSHGQSIGLAKVALSRYKGQA